MYGNFANKITAFAVAVVCMGSAVVSAYAAPVLTEENERECSTITAAKPVLVEETERHVIVAEENIHGDVNGDSYVNITDVSAVSAHIRGIKELGDPSAADMNGDGNVNITDLSVLSGMVKGVR